MRALSTSIAVAVIASFGVAEPRSSAADEPAMVVIVHAKLGFDRLDKKTVAEAFLKKRRRWSEDVAILPVDQRKTAAVRSRFSRSILDRSLASVRTYWNQLIFSGRGVPPPEVDSDAAVVSYVANNPGAIGYVSATTELKGVKVVQVR